MITYNHEQFIQAAIEGVLMQQTNFDLELVIANDCSLDKTDSIINETIKTHPKGNLIKYFRQEKNIGMQPNFLFALNQCEGKYIATCEGDDYWTDPLKLQKQVNILEANPRLSGCFHIVTDINIKTGKIIQTRPPVEQPTIYNTSYILENWNIPICSFIFRNYPIIFPDFNKEMLQGDLTLCLLASLKGDIYFLRENMAVYNIHEGGVSRSEDYFKRIHDNLLSFYKSFDRFTHYKYHRNVYNGIVHFIYNVQFRHLDQYKSPFKRAYMKFIILCNIIRYNRDFSLRFLKIFIGDYLLK